MFKWYSISIVVAQTFAYAVNGFAGTENWSLDIGTRMRRDRAASKVRTAFSVTAIVHLLIVNYRYRRRIQSCVMAIGNGKRGLEVDEEGKN